MEQSKIIKRNFLFWGKYGIQMTAILIGFVVVYGIFFSFGDSSDGGFWTSANYFAILIGILFNYIGPISYGGTYITMVLQMRYGKKGMVFGILITVAVIVSIGAGFVMGSGLIDTLTAWIGNLSGRVISGALFAGAAVAIVLYVISLILQLRVVSKYEVRV